MPVTESPSRAPSAPGPAAPRFLRPRPRPHHDRRALAFSAFLACASACGGIAVIDPGDSGGAQPSGGAGGSSSTVAPGSSSSSISTGTGTAGAGGAPGIPPLVEVDLGEVPIGSTIAVDIPPGTLGFTAVAELLADFPSYDATGIQEIDGPDGRQLAADYSVPGTLALFANYGIGIAAVPQTSAPGSMPFLPGAYQITIGDFGQGIDAPAHLTLWRRQTVDGQFHGGSIDVNVFIAGGAISETYMTTALRMAFQGFVGLDLGEVTFSELGPDWDFIDESNLPLVVEQTAGAPGKPALNVIAVSTFGGELEGAGGVTPSAPAYALKHGTHASGIVVTMFQEPPLDTTILRHEVGHFAGLFHTSEFQAGFGDALDDTPFCADVISQFEMCPDIDNLMFPTSVNHAGTLSTQQTTVMQASTFYRGIVEPGGRAASPLPFRAGGAGGGPSTGGPAPSAAHGAHDVEPLGAWAAALPPRAARLLTGHLCGHTVMRPGKSFFALLQAAGAADPDRLLTLGADPTAPPQARSRALAAAGHAAPSPRALAQLQALAADPRLPRAVRLGAIQGVASASPRLARALAARLKGDPDPVVGRMAIRAAGR